MRVRKLIDGRRQFGHGQKDFWNNVPDGPAQLAVSRLGLWLGQWFLATSDGTPWATRVLGRNTINTRDAAIRARILGTPGVVEIVAYSSSLNRDTRVWWVIATLRTAYGQITIAGPM